MELRPPCLAGAGIRKQRSCIDFSYRIMLLARRASLGNAVMARGMIGVNEIYIHNNTTWSAKL